MTRKQIAEGTVEVTFDLKGKEFPFQAGQYARFTIPKLLYPDQRGNYRDFSIASSPTTKESVTIALRISESGFKKTLLKIPLGAEIKITGPFGDYTLPDTYESPLVFIAGGIGVTPFLSKIRYATEHQLQYKIVLIYGNRDQKSSAYLDELEKLALINANLVFEKVFGPIEEQHIARHVKEFESSRWYIAGPPAMTEAVQQMLTKLGTPQEKIYIEEFLGYEAAGSIRGNASLARSGVLIPKTEQQLLLERESLEAMLTALNQTALVSQTDAEGTIIYANDKFVEVSKYGREDLIGQNHRILKSGYHPTKFYKDLWDTISSGNIWRGEIKNKAKDGTLYWVDTNIAPIIKNRKNTGYISVRFLITDKKNAEEQLGRTLELEQFNKFFVGRELKMVELKKEIEALRQAQGKS